MHGRGAEVAGVQEYSGATVLECTRGGVGAYRGTEVQGTWGWKWERYSRGPEVHY